MADRFVASSEGELLELLARHFTSWSRNTLRQRLRLGCIEVNGRSARSHDEPLRPGDVVEIRSKAESRPPGRAATGPAVLFGDDDLIAIDKPEGLLSVASDSERERTALALVRSSLSRPGRPAALWPVHRLDRETSGVLLFARSAEVRDLVQAGWPSVEKVYTAIVEGRPDPPSGVVDAPLWEDENLRVHVGAHPEARAARTRYTTVAVRGGRSRLEVALDTGKKHQIRAHLAALGHPVVGDARYGTVASRLCLHAERLVLTHPRSRELLRLCAPMPAALLAELDGG
jgi:23S rRNA pseudouridine1911/1915/1917 synthase